ncbi:hypothetical protein [Nonomuraea ferruginea]|uniref:Uncharacterized protein n=1 Tax=Nonomuraea ferruginea TaxID=46174 RepID=A0ABT4SU37_9ACTN|nr:hypothetical protein [Nonomuraea ferruginea]MDA0640555.1 hypothetical protein [Nonomuraea ferruginea]
MTDELESYLRTKLGRAAERAPKAPPRFPAEVVSRSNRRRTARNALVAGVCVAAIALPAGLMAAYGTERGDVATIVPITPTVPPKDYTGDEYRIGEVLTIDNPSQKRPISLWYARTDNGTVLCERVHNRTGSLSAGCGRPLGAEEATEQGSTETFPAPATGLVMYFGTAGDRVARVTALTDAGKVNGTVLQPEDTPQGIWTVTVPSDRTVTAFEFAGREGEAITRIERQQRLVIPEADAQPLGPTVEMPGKLVAGLYETPGKTLIWKLNGQAVGPMHMIERGGPGEPLIDMDGKPMKVELGDHEEHWFGITSTETVRVGLVFKDGTTVKAGTRPNPWKIDGFRLFAGTQRHSDDMYRDGFRIIGYDKDGAELWHEDHGAS